MLKSHVRRSPEAQNIAQFLAMSVAGLFCLGHHKRQRRLRQTLTQHALPTGDVDDWGVGLQPQEWRLDEKLVEKQQSHRDREGCEIPAVEEFSDLVPRQRL